MTEPKIDTPPAEDIIEVIFEDHYMLAVFALVAGIAIALTIVYVMGSREDTPDA
jgi:hypothetical protein